MMRRYHDTDILIQTHAECQGWIFFGYVRLGASGFANSSFLLPIHNELCCRQFSGQPGRQSQKIADRMSRQTPLVIDNGTGYTKMGFV